MPGPNRNAARFAVVGLRLQQARRRAARTVEPERSILEKTEKKKQIKEKSNA